MTVPVFYSISDDFTKYAAVSLNSLVKHASSDTDYTVYFLSQDLSDEHKKDLSALGNENVHVKFFHIDHSFSSYFKTQKRDAKILRGGYGGRSIPQWRNSALPAARRPRAHRSVKRRPYRRTARRPAPRDRCRGSA